VLEVVTRYEVRSGQDVKVEDAKLIGVQRVSFEPGPETTRISLELEVEPKSRMAPVQKLLLRRSLAESLRRTLHRFSVEFAAERQLTPDR
jgi:hypothetical protein